MAIYHANDLIFELPAGLKDKTHHVFTVTDEGPSPFNIVISRAMVDPSETIQSYGARLIADLQRSLPRFSLTSYQEVKVDGSLALRIEYSWNRENISMRQVQFSIFPAVNSVTRKVIQITGTSSGPLSGNWDAAFTTLIATIRLQSSEDTPLQQRA